MQLLTIIKVFRLYLFLENDTRGLMQIKFFDSIGPKVSLDVFFIINIKDWGARRG